METIMEPNAVQRKFKAKSGLGRKSVTHGRGEGLNTAPGSPVKSLMKQKSEKPKIVEKENTAIVPVDDIAKKRAKTLKKFKQSGGTGEVMPIAPSEPAKPPTKLKAPKKLKRDDIATEESVMPVTKPTPRPVGSIIRTKSPKKIKEVQDLAAKYPILNNEVLVQQFLKVPMSNNQKGRIRQAIKESLLGTSNAVVPSIVHSKIQAILRSSPNLTDSQLRRVRILFNLLKTSLNGEPIVEEPKKVPAVDVVTQVSEKLRKRKSENAGSPVKEGDSKIKKVQPVQKVRGPKRYIVFLGNLPLNVDKEMIMAHFSEMNEHIVNVRIPKPRVDKKSTIAYVELSNEASYEFALSKHHSMLGKKRINVLYTSQKNGKVSQAEAKSKSAKLIALQKSGKLVGSIPLAKRRSQRRLKHKQALAKINE